MTSTLTHTLAALACTALLAACAGTAGTAGMSGGWTTLIDGTKGLENFDVVGQANWSGSDGAVQASAGTPPASFIVTRTSYKDVMVRAEFWSSDDANSGIFIRCQDPKTITDENCYEANIFDQRPDPTFATGAIVKVAKLTAPMIKAGGQWNVMEVTAKGTRLTVVLNGTKTVEIDDGKLAQGPIALQWGRGTIKFRKVQVKAI
jgi:Domain of Unknown Function (DUF1080)